MITLYTEIDQRNPTLTVSESIVHHLCHLFFFPGDIGNEISCICPVFADLYIASTVITTFFPTTASAAFRKSSPRPRLCRPLTKPSGSPSERLAGILGHLRPPHSSRNRNLANCGKLRQTCWVELQAWNFQIRAIVALQEQVTRLWMEVLSANEASDLA